MDTNYKWLAWCLVSFIVLLCSGLYIMSSNIGIARTKNPAISKEIPNLERILNSSVLIESTVEHPVYGRGVSQGSGVVINPDGYVLTCSHVVFGAVEVNIIFPYGPFTGVEFEARVIRVAAPPYSERPDVALLRIQSSYGERRIFPYVEVATKEEYDNIRIGETVYAVGFGAGSTTITEGHITRGRNQGGHIGRQINLNILPGSSGGGAYSREGKLIGLTQSVTMARRQLWGFKAYMVDIPSIRGYFISTSIYCEGVVLPVTIYKVPDYLWYMLYAFMCSFAVSATGLLIWKFTSAKSAKY